MRRVGRRSRNCTELLVLTVGELVVVEVGLVELVAKLRERAVLEIGLDALRPLPVVFRTEALVVPGVAHPATLALGRADRIARHDPVEDRVELLIAAAVAPRQAADLGAHDRRHAWPADGHSMALAVPGRAPLLARVVGVPVLRHEAVAEGPGPAVREDPRLALPALAVGGV